MPGSRHLPKVRVLTRRTGVARSNWLPREPLLEIEEIFRIDVVAANFEVPDFDPHVRFVINEGEDWRPPSPPDYYEPEPEFEIDPDDSGISNWVNWLYLGILSQGGYDAGLAKLANSINWATWWQEGGSLDGYQDLHSLNGLCELRRRYQALPDLEKNIIIDFWEYLEIKGDHKNQLRLAAYFDDLSEAAWHFNNSLNPGLGEALAQLQGA